MRYIKGAIVSGKVTGVEKYGIFVALDGYYTGLVHISEMSNSFVRDVGEFVSIGDTIKVRVIGCDRDSFHLKLSIKDVEYKSGKSKKQKIVETKRGFDPLAEHLGDWVETKIMEINKKNQNIY